MYLSRLELNPRSHEVRRDLSDVYQMHRTVMAAFPNIQDRQGARAGLAVLYRVETGERSGGTVLLVQSEVLPDWTRLPTDYLSDSGGEVGNPATRDTTQVLAALREGQVLRFRLRANPTRKIETKSDPDGRRQNGRRVDLRTETQQLEWLSRRAEQAGFVLVPVQSSNDVLAVRVGAVEKLLGKGRRLTLAGVLFDGLLEVTHPDRLRCAVTNGIGPGKAFGCGLLSIAPLRRYD